MATQEKIRTHHESGGMGSAFGGKPEEASRSHRILLVEDYPANILVASTLIDSFGYKCVSATNGPQALELMKQQHFDVVLMDIQMGEMDGYETTRRFRQWEEAARKGSRLPIIAMTAHALLGDREKCLNAGMDDYISKPINVDSLEIKLARFLASHIAA